MLNKGIFNCIIIFIRMMIIILMDTGSKASYIHADTSCRWVRRVPMGSKSF